MDAAIEARAAGLVRFIGVTGHGWNVAAMHRRSLERFDFDSLLMPWNWLAVSKVAGRVQTDEAHTSLGRQAAAASH